MGFNWLRPACVFVLAIFSVSECRAVGLTELAGLADSWLSISGEGAYKTEYDYYPDGVIDMEDIAILSSSWGYSGKLYVVSTTGNDTYPGTAVNPFRTIQKAASVMAAGDVCFIRAGTYRETVTPSRSGTATRPITFAAYPGETPVISGADLVSGPWTVHSESIYKATLYSPSVDYAQLFVDGQMYNEARWPNSEINQLVTMNRATAMAGTNTTTLVDSALPAGNWAGATVHIVSGDEWISSSKLISNYTPGVSLTFANGTWVGSNEAPYLPRAGNPYWLFGALAGLDIAGEWCMVKASGSKYTCYLWCEGDASPASHTVEFKKRQHAFNLTNRSYIQLKGLRMFAAAILMDGSQSCVIEDCHLKYVDHFRSTDGYSTSHSYTRHANRMGGGNNIWKECSVVYSAGNGIYDRGQNNTVSNCIIREVNYMATYAGCLLVEQNSSTGGRYLHNTMYNSGRFIVYHNGTFAELSYNHLYNAGFLTRDCGITYTWGTDGGGAEISYNKVHDNFSGSYPFGIYIDNGCANYVIHHNLLSNLASTAIMMSGPIDRVHAYNNTILASCGHAFNQWTPPEYPSDQSTCNVINNLHQCPIGSFATIRPYLSNNGNYAINPDGTLTPTSGAINAGMIIPGITEGYAGSAPDIGCYEYGIPKWTAGADWTEVPW